MGIMEMLLGRKTAPATNARHSRPGPSTQFDSQHTGSGSQSVRKDLLKLALRETLTRNGIPPTWVSADMLRTSNARREAGLHVRFQLRHWDPRLLPHLVALENVFTQRLLLLDPLARNWLAGFSWQFNLDDVSHCPALPHPATWSTPAEPSAPAPLRTQPAPLSTQPAGLTTQPGALGIIEGPAAAPRDMDEVRADLERLLAQRDQDMHASARAEQAFAPTRPAAF